MTEPAPALTPSVVVAAADRALRAIGRVRVHGRVTSLSDKGWLNLKLVDAERPSDGSWPPTLAISIPPTLADLHRGSVAAQSLVTVTGDVQGSRLDGSPQVFARSVIVHGAASTLTDLASWQAAIRKRGFDRMDVPVSPLLRRVWIAVTSDMIFVDVTRQLAGAPCPQIRRVDIPGDGVSVVERIRLLMREARDQRPDLVVIARGGSVEVPSIWDHPDVTNPIIRAQQEGIVVAAAIGHSDVVPLTEVVAMWSDGQPMGVGRIIRDHQLAWCGAIEALADAVAVSAPARTDFLII